MANWDSPHFFLLSEVLFLIYAAPLKGEHAYIFMFLVIYLVISRLDTELVAKNSTDDIKDVLTSIELTVWREIQRVLCIKCLHEEKYFEEKGRIKTIQSAGASSRLECIRKGILKRQRLSRDLREERCEPCRALGLRVPGGLKQQ